MWVVIIGAGIAGVAAAYQLLRRGASATVMEADYGAPVLGPDPRLARAFHLQALGSVGLTIGPYLGVQCADMALGLPGTDLTEFTRDRLVAA